MLSKKINSLRMALQPHCNDGVNITPDALMGICVVLMTLERDAEALEAAQISPVALVGLDLPLNVIARIGPAPVAGVPS